MKPETKILLEEYKHKFKTYKDFLDKNDWVNDVKENEKGTLYSEKLTTEFAIVDTILKSMIKFKEDVGEDLSLKVVKDFINQTVLIIKKHISKIDLYEKKNPLQAKSENRELEEFNFQTKLFQNKVKSKVSLSKLNIDEEDSLKKSADLFYGNAKAPLVMREFLYEKIPDIKKKTDALAIDFSVAHVNPTTSNEMLINMKPNDIPEWFPNKHFFEQPLSTIQFWEEERIKMTKGINIGGYHISPWLYWHINIFKMSFGEGDSKAIQNPHFRDNEFFFDYMYNKAKNHGRKGLFMYGSRRFAKALKNDEKLYYYDGTIRNIGDSKIGDEIIGRDGKKTTITGVYPQGKLKLYRVTLADKREVICCDDHLWTVFDIQAGREKVMPLKEMRKYYKYDRVYSERRTNTCYNYYIPLNKEINFKSSIKSFVDPYFLGTWLGDGDSRSVRVTTIDTETVEYLKNFSEENDMDLGNSGIAYSPIKKRGKSNPIIQLFKSKNLIGNKHIPEECFQWSNKDKLSLIQGLMDTDGTAGINGNSSFTNTNRNIIEGFLRICRELGIGVYPYMDMTGGYTLKNGDKNKYHKIAVFTKKPIFRLTRKKERHDQVHTRSNVSRTFQTPIINIEEWGEDYATCIRVDNEDSTFLTTNCVVTHNSAGMTSRLLHTMWTVKEAKGTVIGFSKTPDLEALIDYANIHIQNTHPALKIPSNSLTIEDGIALGLKGKKVQDIYDTANLTIINLEGGVTKKGSQKTAAGTPDAFLLDEAGKGACIPSWKAALPSFEGGKNNTFRCTPLISGTAGEGALSQDAETMLKEPETFDILPMDWDFLEEFVDPDYVTWKRNSFGFFIPAQMSLGAPDKLITPFGDFLDVGINTKNLNLEELNKLKIHVTDWETSKNFFESKRKELQSNLDLLSGYTNSFPMDPEDCYLSSEVNIFPAMLAKNRRKIVEENGLQGQKVWLRKSGDRIEMDQTTDPIIRDYPYKGGNFDAPIVILDDPYDKDGNKPPLGLYCAGFDDVKQSTSSGDSVMSCTIFKRSYEGGEWANRIVAYYDSRPERKRDYYRNLYLLLKLFNARLLHENEDNGFVEYMEENHMDEIYTHLSDGVGMATEENLNRNKNRKFGWSPTTLNIYNLTQTMVMYTKEEGVKIGEEDNLTGIDRINHPMLLEEMFKYKKDLNADRLRSFGLALKLARYYDKTNSYMKFRKKQFNEEETSFKKKKRTIGVKGFSFTNKLKKF